MIIVVEAKVTADPSRAIQYVAVAMLVDGQIVSGRCGITIIESKFKEWIERINPDILNGSEYNPSMPIVLEQL
jgi:hypothetical protein